jgi:hypothetical protein
MKWQETEPLNELTEYNMNDIDTNAWKHQYCTVPIKGKYSEEMAERLKKM